MLQHLLFIIAFSNPETPAVPNSVAIIVLGFTAVVVLAILYFFFLLIEYAYSLKYFKPLVTYFHPFKKRLVPKQLQILEDDFSFYKSLSTKHKRIFEHRVFCFIKDKKFIVRDSLVITNEIKVLISATAIMLTFGFRKYLIDAIDTIIVYPDEYYSKLNDAYHKGEFNPMAEVLVLSWKDFLEGYKDENDNINLGIHEVIHAIHLNSIKKTDISALIFKKKYAELTDYLSLNESIRLALIDSKYFREYAFTNQYEFLAVLVETFMETPQEFNGHFPDIYNKIKGMLNFNFSGY